MNCQLPFPGVQLSVLFIISFSLAHGYPPSLNWCAFIVQKNVSRAVQGSVESHVEPEAARCPEHQPDCEPQMIYRTRFQPTYKIAYKTVTELEWRCCPGYQGPDCRELKDSPNGQIAFPQSNPQQAQHGQRPERRETGQYDIRRTADKTRILEEEVQRLSQTVLDLQAAMTGMAKNLRTDLQEDTSKMLITLLSDRTSPDSTRTGGTEESVVHLDGHQAMRGQTHGEREMKTLLAKLNDMTDALKSKDEALEELRGTVTGHDGQIRMLMDSSSQGLPVTGAGAPDIDILQTYIDGKFEKLKKELVVNMEEEMAKLKNACDEKIQSLPKTCEDGKDSSYVSLTDLVHNKEAELRKEIRELRLELSMSDGVVRPNRQTTIGKDDGDYDDLKKELIRVAEAHRVLNARVDNELEHLSSLKIEDVLGSRLEDLEDRMNVTERNAETYCFYVDEKLTKEIMDEVAMLRQLLDQKLKHTELLMLPAGKHHNQIEELKDQVDALKARVTTELSVCKFNTAGVAEGVSAVDNRVTALEKICGRLDGERNNIQGPSGELERKVAQMNSTLGSHSGAITALQNSLLNFQSQLAGMARQIHKDHTRKEQGLPVQQKRPVSTPYTRAPTQPMRPYVPHIHIPLIIPHRTVPSPTSRPHVRQPHVPHQPYFPQPPGSPRHPIHPVPPHQPAVHQPVVVTGQAGPPGYVRRVTRHQRSEDSKTHLKGFAGAPGYPPVNPVSYNTKQSHPEAAHVPWNPAYQRPIATPVSQQNSLTDPFSFSAGLTRQMFSGDFGIIHFDRVLVNDGGHYNPQTGIFRVPADGRYLVTAVLTAPQGEHAEAVLSVSNRSVQKLNTAGYWSGHPRLSRDQCACGGSASFSLILPLRQGNTVALVRTAGKLAISESREILSTFSAIFLYSPQAKR
uniref:Elastin microfibril interfacer 2a n=1 Tax=Cyprinus carpio TaxID=7962 RepID=A0A8C2CN26_CYPCA